MNGYRAKQEYPRLKELGWVRVSYNGQHFYFHPDWCGNDSTGTPRIVCLREAIVITNKEQVNGR